MLPLLDVQHLTVSFGNVPVVRDLSFRLFKGRTLCLVGESGSGKSMTAFSLMRLVPEPGRIVSGSLLFAGEDLLKLDEKAMRGRRGRDISMIFQEPMTSLNPVLRIGGQIAEPLEIHQKLSHREALEKAAELMALVGIPDPHRRLSDYPHQFSGGMRQRVMIAMALACSPKLLLADEPTTALDITIQGQILRLLGRLARERDMGVLLITHDLGVVAEAADDVAVMYAGELVEQAPVNAFFERPLHPYSEGLMACAPLVGNHDSSRLPSIPGMVPLPSELPEGCAFRPRCPHASPECLTTPPLQSMGEGHLVRCWKPLA
ncbi:ABC transporter ATP-binding protein [uncultured Mailhella sp.]|uniref:ABC transporter ATP-binding protein n=1 Tax=uncultured Mailhella sp. TaxID=1981031 RepID=UPI0025E26CDB|nr:ABC transporter ATP-binding protein [uncultured Mailhella sp.]